jgi:hypothetical protein
MFKYVFGLTAKRMQILQTKMKANECLKDKRGSHENRPNKVSDEVRDLVKAHIESFPSQESHYSRVKNKLLCLAPNLTVNKMAIMFNEKHPENKVNVHFYRDTFNSEFNLRFGAPRSDTCPKCDRLFVRLVNATSADERRKIAMESELHHRKAEKSYACLKEDTVSAKENPRLHVVFTDLEQVLFSPNLTHSNVFYQRQYSTYNYAVHSADKGDATMFLWHESVAKRGSAEIASCFLKYVTDNFEPLTNHEDRKLVVWSDRCVGQNNNWKMLAMFKFLIKAKYYTQVEQKFLCSGHSFLPCDRDFALIERKKKTAVINVPFDWVEMIVAARPSNPFLVTIMNREDFKDFSPLETALYRNPKLKITDKLWFKFVSDDPDSIHTRVGHNVSQPWVSYTLRKRMAVPCSVDNPRQLKELYKGPIAIKKEKKADLISMSDLLCDPAHRQFYIDLITED